MSNKQDIEKLFEDEGVELPDIDGLDLVNIDLDAINEFATNDAKSLVSNIIEIYYNDEFMKAHPNLKRQIDAELESLRILLKMRKADEEAHDILVKAIAGNSGNASLYKSLAEMQKTVLSITSKITDTISGLRTLLKGYQLELNFEAENKQEEVQGSGDLFEDNTTCRGSKEFIERMKQKEEGD
jgi:hypothetical protein